MSKKYPNKQELIAKGYEVPGARILEELREQEIREDIIECSICDSEIPRWESNNAQPINTGECCDDCNYQYVVPERMKNLFKKGAK
jgi:hypothetical protein